MKKPTISSQIINVIGSSKFFWGIIVLFVIEAAWIALSAAYPMAFDENYHLGIIKLYADHLSPFWQAQPPNSDAFGVVHRDTSYMYQYLMSFPYVITTWFTSSQTIQVLVLRAINIAMFASGIFIFRKLLIKSNASSVIINSCLLVFVLIPAVPLLASQINYDNLFMPLVGLALLQTIKVARNIKARKSSVLFDSVMLLSLCLFTSIVKYAFLPFFLAIIAYLITICALEYKQFGVVWSELKKGLQLFKKPMGIVLIVGFVSIGVLFAERFVVNTLKYHTPVPECSSVLSEESCSQYGPWNRDHLLAQNKPAGSYNPVKFNVEWFDGMWMRLYFSLGGPDTGYQTRKPMPVPYKVSVITASIGAALAVFYAPKIWRKYDSRVLSLFLSVSSLYIAVLWLDQYQSYIKTGQPVAINGRYLLPVIPLLMLVMVLGFNELLKKRNNFKVVLLGAFVICMLYGGGTLTFIIRSNDTWYWNNSAVHTINSSIRDSIGPLIIGSKQP